ncbi:ABC transporter ATP-binding protein [Gryllotalpicola daejeonensis]|uniref:ABC transporter ATP-binding protein n=1 Tax=Gryllotalpicola daejeonensis TaxID=993087 RepID=A0ABP7ZEP6_9MICO
MTAVLDTVTRSTPAGSAGATGVLEVRGISKSFPSRTDGKAAPTFVPALLPTDLVAKPGEFVTIVGPSGCGKSTLFSIVAGLEHPTDGGVFIDGVDHTAEAGLVGYMLQKDMLLPWRTVLNNVILGLEIQGVPREASVAAARPLLQRYGLGQYEDAKPAHLSGGMRQRAALLRTLLFNRQIMLLDEPFGALDAQTRLQMQLWLLDVQATFKKTIVFVTHDIDEAVFLSDRIYVMKGRPGAVAEVIDVDLPRPRAASVSGTPRFVELREHVRQLLMNNEEV